MIVFLILFSWYVKPFFSYIYYNVKSTTILNALDIGFQTSLRETPLWKHDYVMFIQRFFLIQSFLYVNYYKEIHGLSIVIILFSFFR